MTHRTAACIVLVGGILLPALYLFAMIQYSAVTLPYADHLATAEIIVRYFDGNLTFSDLIRPQSQARPLFPRLIFIANAALTNWDIRSEFIYIHSTIYGTLAALLIALWKVSRNWSRPTMLAAGVLISVIACSPAGSNNHYWSLMLLETLSYMCSIAALLLVSLQPASPVANISAAVLAWIAAFSISQGLLVFPAVVLLLQSTAGRFKPTLWSIFWVTNLIACYAIYFIILGGFAGSHPTSVWEYLVFIPIYVGNPLGSLLWFNPWIFDSTATTLNAICGAFVLVVTVITIGKAWPELRSRSEARIFLSLAAFAIASAVLTGWGRASGPESFQSANSSRYSIYAACMLFGLIFYYAAQFGRKEIVFSNWHGVAVSAFLVAAAVSYDRAVPLYRTYHGYDSWLSAAYPRDGGSSDIDSRAYPDLTYFRNVKADLFRLHLGPYRF